MNYFKSFLGGIAASTLCGVIYMAVSLARTLRSSNGDGGIFISNWIEISPLFFMLLMAAFALGFFWVRRRTSA